MAWSSPATFTDGAVLTAAQLNAIRDNLNETAPAKATAAGGFIVTTGLNSVVQRTPATASMSTAGPTSSTSFGDLSPPAAVGPLVTVVTGSAAFVAIAAQGGSDLDNRSFRFGFTVSGATTIAATDADSGGIDGIPASNNSMRLGVSLLRTGLTAGSNTFTMKYRVGSSATTATFDSRRISVIPF